MVAWLFTMLGLGVRKKYTVIEIIAEVLHGGIGLVIKPFCDPTFTRKQKKKGPKE